MAFLSWLVRWSLHNRPIVLVVVAIFVVLGVRAAAALPVDAVPDVTSIQVPIITPAPALSPVEVEKYVSIPVERAMAGIPHTTEVRSMSKYGLSHVTVVFEDGTDIYFARQQVAERMSQARAAVPRQYGEPEMGPISTGLGEIYQFTLESREKSLMDLHEILTWEIAPQLRTVPGIVEVSTFGGEEREFQVALDPKRLQASGMSVADVVSALEHANANAGGGYIEHNREHIVVGTDGLVKDLDDLKRVVLGATPEGIPITVATVGEARFGPRLRRGAATKDGEGEVAVGVTLMLMGENSRVVTSAVKKKLDEIAPSLPKGVKIAPFYDRSELVGRTTRTVGKNLLEGALLVILVLFVLLGDFRAGVVVAAVIPLSLLFALIVMNWAGLSGNLMSLGAIDFGLIVDGSVIIVENAVRRLSEEQKKRGRELSPEERLGVVESATMEVRKASVFGEAIIAIVYVPILALVGIEGKLFRPMALTVLFALSGAFLLSLTLIPVLTSYFVRPKAAGAHETWPLRMAQRALAPLLRGAFRHRLLTVGAGVVALSAAALVFTRIGAEFVPQLDEGDLIVEARRLPGVALSESVANSLRVERVVRDMPEVDHVVTRTGAPSVATDPMGLEESDVYVSLKDRAKWRKGVSKEVLANEISERLDELVPDGAWSISQPIQMRTNELIAGVRSDVAVLVYGPELDELKRLGERVADVVRDIPGAVDVRVEHVAGLRYMRVAPERPKLARYGLSVADINQITETIAVGRRVGDVLENERRFGIVVKTDHGYDGELEPLLSLPLKSISGQIVPLGDVADLDIAEGPAHINRKNQSRRLTIEFNVRGRDMMSVVEDAQAAIGSTVKAPEGYHFEWGGQFEHYEEAKLRLALVVPAALFLIFFLLWLAFRSVKSALLIFLNVPFAVVGGVFALAVRGIPFSISAGVGFIALSGVAVLNGLVLISFSRRLEKGGVERDEAIRTAVRMRLRPVLMTALVAALGFVPMSISTAAGSEVQRPLATVVIGGIVTATLLTLLFLPVVYAFVGRRVSGSAATRAREPTSGVDSDGA